MIKCIKYDGPYCYKNKIASTLISHTNNLTDIMHFITKEALKNQHIFQIEYNEKVIVYVFKFLECYIINDGITLYEEIRFKKLKKKLWTIATNKIKEKTNVRNQT